MLTMVERIATGAHGEVYDARWGGRRVAAKVLAPTAAVCESSALRLAGQLRALGCDAFIELLDVTVVEGRWTLVLEWVDGPDLTTAREQAALSRAGIHGVLAQCAHALRTAWTACPDGEPLRLVHRDLKPANLLLQPDGRVRIADLGLASRCIRPGFEPAGTPAYAAPERWIGEDGPKSDVYSLGAIAYALCTGRTPPVAGPHPTAHARRVRALAADLRESAPDDLVEQVCALLHWDPENRPSTDTLVELGPNHAALRAWLRPSLWTRFTRLFTPRPAEVPCTPL